jgi:hypothetical protein
VGAQRAATVVMLNLKTKELVLYGEHGFFTRKDAFGKRIAEEAGAKNFRILTSLNIMAEPDSGRLERSKGADAESPSTRIWHELKEYHKWVGGIDASRVLNDAKGTAHDKLAGLGLEAFGDRVFSIEPCIFLDTVNAMSIGYKDLLIALNVSYLNSAKKWIGADVENELGVMRDLMRQLNSCLNVPDFANNGGMYGGMDDSETRSYILGLNSLMVMDKRLASERATLHACRIISALGDDLDVLFAHTDAQLLPAIISELKKRGAYPQIGNFRVWLPDPSGFDALDAGGEISGIAGEIGTDARVEFI